MKAAPPPKQEPPPPAAPPQQEPPPQKAPPKVDPPALWNVKADPSPAAVKLPADFKKEIKAPGALAQLVFPKQSSPFVAVGTNLRADDERQVWNLQTGQMTGKVVGTVLTINGAPPVLSPDGAYLAYSEKPGTVGVWAPGPGKKVSVEVGGDGFLSDYTDFAGGKLLTLRRTGTTLTFQTWDPATGQNVLSFTPPGRMTGLRRDAFAISPGGGYLALASREGLRVYELKAGTTVGERALGGWEAGRLYACHGLSFSPDGGELAGVFFANGTLPHLVCWDVARGEVVCDVTFPQALPAAAVQGAYKGHVLDWIGDRRGWLLYGYTMVDRNKDGSATFLPTPPAEGSPVPRHMVGPAHVATLTPSARPGEKVLTVSKFDPDTPN
jgi:WD40 repeat protein